MSAPGRGKLNKYLRCNQTFVASTIPAMFYSIVEKDVEFCKAANSFVAALAIRHLDVLHISSGLHVPAIRFVSSPGQSPQSQFCIG
jgi:hypothetical protein